MKNSYIYVLITIAIFAGCISLFAKESQKSGAGSFSSGSTDFGTGSKPGDLKTLTVRGIDYDFRWCPPGEFMMGSPESEEGRKDEETLHREKITHGFWLLETEVTQGMWESVMKTTVSEQFDKAKGKVKELEQYNERKDKKDGELVNMVAKLVSACTGTNYPIFYVSWNESQEFCEKLSNISGAAIRLPAEAEWEYACRAGTYSTYYFGDDIGKMTEYGNVADAAFAGSEIAAYFGKGFFADNSDMGKDLDWYTITDSDGFAYASLVKSFKPNAWGLYDMLGNVTEWCSDLYVDDAVSTSPATESRRIIRGGCYGMGAEGNRSAARTMRGGESDRCAIIGFRIVLAPSNQ